MSFSVTGSAVLVGWHSWPEAGGRRTYLAASHRHQFGVSAEVGVTHTDRDVEFHDLQDMICAWWGEETDQRDRGSCEAMAGNLAGWLSEAGLAVRATSVSEDGENWATWRPD